VNIARFLAEVNRRTHNAIPPEIDPIGIIPTRVELNPNTLESRVLKKATLATITTHGEMSESDIWALSRDALVLLDTFADCVERGRYRRQDIETVATKLRDG
jgi:hypothetical protein